MCFYFRREGMCRIIDSFGRNIKVMGKRKKIRILERVC